MPKKFRITLNVNVNAEAQPASKSGATCPGKCNSNEGIHIMKSRLAGLVICLTVAVPAYAIDDAAAMKLLEDSKCLKCHSVDKKKDGPSYKETAAKYKGKAEAEAKLTKHVTVPSKVKIDGVEEDHGAVKTRDAEKVRNLVQWILSR